MESETIVKLMERLQSAFIPEKSAGMKGNYQCHITGVENGDWVMSVEDGQCRITPGELQQPRATLEIDARDLTDLLSGKLDPLRAFFSGTLQLTGDTNAVIKLLSMFHMDTARYK
jgi:putative sterol carrier protein